MKLEISYRELTDLITYVKKLKIDTRTTILTKSNFLLMSQKTNLSQSDKLFSLFGKDESIDCIEVVVAVSFLVEWRDVEKQYQMKSLINVFFTIYCLNLSFVAIFEVIDVNNDGSVEKDEMMNFFFKYFRVKSKMNGYPFTKPRWLALKDHIERNFAASDIDHNGVVDCLCFSA